jgi:voltage-gated potassium channel
MPLLILGTLGAIWTLRHDRQFVSLALLAAVAIVSGTGFYSLVEDLRFVDALYFSVVTLTTVGYGDYAPQTDIGKIFTAVYVLVGVGILLAFVTTVATKVSQMSLLHAPTGRTTQSHGFVRRRSRSLPSTQRTESRDSAGSGVPRLSATMPRYVVPRWHETYANRTGCPLGVSVMCTIEWKTRKRRVTPP